jgi:hypothetical protein
MHIKSLKNDEQYFETPGIWAPTILSPGRKRTSTIN